MGKVVASVRITPIANQRLTQLAAKLRQPKSQVIEEALAVLEEHVFWGKVQEAFASGESPVMREEREVWDPPRVMA